MTLTRNQTSFTGIGPGPDDRSSHAPCDNCMSSCQNSVVTRTVQRWGQDTAIWLQKVLEGWQYTGIDYAVPEDTAHLV
jgi:hypothetical protein